MITSKIVPVEPYQRKYLEKGVKYNQWESLSKFSQELMEQTIDSTEDLIDFLNKKNELDVIVYEELATHRLRAARFTNENDPIIKKNEAGLQSNSMKTDGILTKKILNSPYLADLIKEKPEYRQMLLNIQNKDKVYVEKNGPIDARINELVIEYVFAQFGAFEIYQQYLENPKQTIDNMIAAMKLGNTRSIQEVYKVAGIQFDFSEAQMKKSAEFLKTEYNRLFEQLELVKANN